jgi:hypothetical protein
MVRLQGDFSSYPVIEDLTHKTGNFKQFNIFCNMLESALTQVGTRVEGQGRFCPPDPGGRYRRVVCRALSAFSSTKGPRLSPPVQM